MILYTLTKKKELQSSLGDATSHNQSEAHSYPSLTFHNESNNIIYNEDNDDDKDDEKDDDLIEINISRSLDFIFKEEGLMDLLEEMNEDENLFEIDIFKGFTKYQDFRFKELAYLGD